jgi:hypothetical protein
MLDGEFRGVNGKFNHKSAGSTKLKCAYLIILMSSESLVSHSG